MQNADIKIAVDNPLLRLSHCVKQQITKTPNRHRHRKITNTEIHENIMYPHDNRAHSMYH